MAKVDSKDLNELFPSLEAEHIKETNYDFFDYDRLTLQDVGDGEFYQGKPILSEVSDVTFDEDGEEVTRYRCQLWLVDDDAEEFLQININLKNSTDLQTNVHYKSSLYKLVAGINEQLMPGWATQHNYLNRCDLSETRNFLDNVESMTIQVKEVTGTFDYFTFLVKEIQNNFCIPPT